MRCHLTPARMATIKKSANKGVSLVAQQVTMRMQVRFLALLSRLRIRHCRELCGESCTCSSDPVLLWLWCRPAAPAPIQLLAGELPYAAGAALKKKTKQTKKKSANNKCWRVWRKRKPSYTVGGNVNWYNHYGKQYGGSSKI